MNASLDFDGFRARIDDGTLTRGEWTGTDARGRETACALAARFWSKVVVSENLLDCWHWHAVFNRNGYGRFSVGHRMLMSHRVAYQLSVGEIPEGLQLDHLCRNRACCNPWHLEPVSSYENTARGLAWAYEASKTHCPSGHEYSPSNTYRRCGYRQCRTCKRENKRTVSERRLADAIISEMETAVSR